MASRLDKAFGGTTDSGQPRKHNMTMDRMMQEIIGAAMPRKTPPKPGGMDPRTMPVRGVTPAPMGAQLMDLIRTLAQARTPVPRTGREDANMQDPEQMLMRLLQGAQVGAPLGADGEIPSPQSLAQEFNRVSPSDYNMKGGKRRPKKAAGGGAVDEGPTLYNPSDFED